MALMLYRSLCLAKELWKGGTRSANEIRQGMRDLLDGEPEVRTDYVSVADAETLEELEIASAPALVSLAATIGKTRLIDNVVLE